MTQQTVSLESQAAALSEAANESVHDVSEIDGVDQHPVTAAAQALGFTTAVGMAAFVGRYASGDYAVQSTQATPATRRSGPRGPPEVAKGALENGKQLLVGSNGDPFGSNLVFVLEFA